MKFHAVLLYIDDQFPDISIFRKLQEVGRGLYPKGAYLYSVEQKLIADRFYWMYFQYDNAKLYSDKVIDTEDNSVKENPRPKSQVEPRLQLFSCYDLESHILYVSDYSKKATITDYISESTFNFSTLISSVEINVIKDDDYRYEPSIVKTLLVNQLGGANA